MDDTEDPATVMTKGRRARVRIIVVAAAVLAVALLLAKTAFTHSGKSTTATPAAVGGFSGGNLHVLIPVIFVRPSGSSTQFDPFTNTSTESSGSIESVNPGWDQNICPGVAGATEMAGGMEMAPTTPGYPTPAQQDAAHQLVTQVTADIQRYSNVSAAVAAGYQADPNPNDVLEHDPNWSIVKSGDVLDPDNPPMLMYVNSKKGPVLVGAMYVGPGPCQPGPDIGGSLTAWHAHDQLCLDDNTEQLITSHLTGPCPPGSWSFFMLHVWTAPSIAANYQFDPDVPEGPLQQIVDSGTP